jgi:hypothetical protein
MFSSLCARIFNCVGEVGDDAPRAHKRSLRVLARCVGENMMLVPDCALTGPDLVQRENLFGVIQKVTFKKRDDSGQVRESVINYTQ